MWRNEWESFPSRFSSLFFLSAIDKVLLAARRGDGDLNPQVQLGPAGVGSSDWGIKNGSIQVILHDSSPYQTQNADH